ncbi:g2075 [Coccomyxa elongata]
MGRRQTTSKAAPKELDKSDALFSSYKDATEDSIGPEGVEKLCSDLKVDPSSRQVLLLSWKMEAQRMGYFSREEFSRGLRALNATTIDKLRKALPKLEEEVDANPEAFSSFFTFAFKFCLTEPRQKIIDIETAVQMLSIAMPPSEPHLAPFISFLQTQKEYKAINLDQWTSFQRFAEEVKPDCSNFDESQAWPLLLDNYVEHVKKQQGQEL